MFTKNNTSGTFNVYPKFEIYLHKKDLDVLLRIKEYYGVGTIIIGKTRDICIFRVTKIKTYLM